MDPHPAIFDIELQDPNKKTNFLKRFSANYFVMVHFKFSKIKSQQEATKQ